MVWEGIWDIELLFLLFTGWYCVLEQQQGSSTQLGRVSSVSKGAWAGMLGLTGGKLAEGELPAAHSEGSSG